MEEDTGILIKRRNTEGRGRHQQTFSSSLYNYSHWPQSTIYLFYFQVFLTDPRSPILDPAFPVNLEVWLINIVFFLDHWSNHLFQSTSNQRFQAIEFVDRHVPEKLYNYGTSILWTWSAASRARDSQVQSYPYKHIRNVRRVVEVASSSSRRWNHWYLKYL